jgi:hypothetical protein
LWLVDVHDPTIPTTMVEVEQTNATDIVRVLVISPQSGASP